ncbi:hypothetical protein CRENBAI_008724 [Crenichthys baileyi]|uniref:DNA-directed DNA polymerase n=1 Tax=Crenichthys baileyi TaxID=28760 RepID=A0AAV9RN17_9TELE
MTPQCRNVSFERESDLLGVMIKSVLLCRQDGAFLDWCCNLQTSAKSTKPSTSRSPDWPLWWAMILTWVSTSTRLVETHSWDEFRRMRSVHFAGEPESISVLHKDTKRMVNSKANVINLYRVPETRDVKFAYLLHRCRATLNTVVVVRGRGDKFNGFVQSIHLVQIPQLEYKLYTLRGQTGSTGKELDARLRWDLSKPSLLPRIPGERASTVRAQIRGRGVPCVTHLRVYYAGPGMGLELSFDFLSIYPSIVCALNISPETTVPWPPDKVSS